MGNMESQEHKQVTTSTGNSQTEQLEKQSIWAHKNLDNEKSNEGRSLAPWIPSGVYRAQLAWGKLKYLKVKVVKKKNATDAGSLSEGKALCRVAKDPCW